MLGLSLSPCNQLLTGFQTNALRTSRNGFRSTGTLCEQSLQETIRRLECLSTAEIQVLAHKSVKQLNKVLNADASKAPSLEENLGLVYNALQSNQENKGYFQSKLFSTKPSPFLVNTRGFKTKRSDPKTDKPFTFLNEEKFTSIKSRDENKTNEALEDILKQIDMAPKEKEKLNIAVLSYAAGLKQGDKSGVGSGGAAGDEKKHRFEWFKGFDSKLWTTLNKFGTVLFIVASMFFLSQFFNVRFSVTKGGANEIAPEDIEVTFDDVKGCDEAKKELMEVVEFLVNPEKFSNLGGRLPKGCLLVGPPGTGKTLLARAVAGEAGVPFFHAAGSEFDEVLVGQGARRVRDLFKAAKDRAPCVLFIDEIDSVGGRRTNSALHPYANQTINQLLSEMDGFVSNEGVIVLGATNRAEDLDKALLRPGRFDTQVTVGNPDIKGRREILILYLSKIKHDDSVDIEKLARLTTGFCGAELQNMVNTAAIRAAVDGKDCVSMAEFEYSHDKLVMGTDWKSRVRERTELENTAYHEAGHVLVAYFTKDSTPLHKVTIVAKGQSGGHTAFIPEKDSWQVTKSQLIAQMDSAMGGRAAEELIFGKEKVTSGASSDLERATSISEQMVKSFGMSEKIGLRVVKKDEMAPGSTELMDIEINRLLNESYKRATNILIAHRRELDLLAEALLQYETLDAEDIKCIVENKRPPPPRPAPGPPAPSKGLKPRIQIPGLPVVQGPEVMS